MNLKNIKDWPPPQDKKKRNKLIIIFSSLGVLTLSLGLGLGLGLSNKEKKEIITKNGTKFEVYTNESANEKFVVLPKYELEYTNNAYALDGNPLIPGNLASTDYTNGKDGFFKLDYANAGYVKLDFDTNKVLGGWEQDANMNTAPTRIQGAIDTPDDYNWGRVFNGAVLFHLPSMIKALKKTTADPDPNISFYVDSYWVSNTSRYFCLDPDPKKVVASNAYSSTESIGKYDLFSSPGSAKAEDQVLPNNSENLCFENNTTTRKVTNIPFLFNVDSRALFFFLTSINSDITETPNHRTVGFASFTDYNVQNRISQVGYFDHPAFGRVRVNAYNRFVNPYTMKEENLILENNKVIFEKTDLSMKDFNAELYQSTSYGANHIVQLLSDYYELTDQEKTTNVGTNKMNEIIDVSRQHSVICVPEDDDLTLFESTIRKLTRTTAPNRANETKQSEKDSTKKVDYSFIVNGYLNSETKKDINIECRLYDILESAGGLHKYVGYIFPSLFDEIRNSEKLIITEKIMQDWTAQQIQYNLFCLIVESSGSNMGDFTLTDAEKFNKYKERFPKTSYTTWTEAKTSLKFLPGDLYFQRSYNNDAGGRTTVKYRFECYQVKK